MLGRRSATILSIFMATVMLGSIIAVTMPSSYVQDSDNNDIKKLELSTTDTQVDTKRLAKINLPFIENNGQIHEDVKYYASTFAGTAFVTEDHITYSLMKSSPKEEDGENQIQGIALKESFLTKEALHPRGLDRSDSIVNYFVGAEENWRSNVPTYNAVSLGELWPYVDVELKAYGANIEKIFKVYPGGSVEDIRLSLDGVLSLNVNEECELILETELGDLAMTKPVAFQDIDGVQKDVEAFYLVEGSTYGFAVGDYDPHYPLVIDPLLASTFIGGGGDDRGFAIALDSSDNVFVTGFTGSSDYPTTTGAFDETHNAGRDVFVTKLKNDLSGPLLASTFIGGGADDRGLAIVLDSSGNLLVAGLTTSSNYPTTTGAFDETHNGSLDVFVTKLTGDLSLMEATAEPHTTIDSAVDGNSIVVLDGGSTISDSMTFTFSGTDDSGVASFECDIDIGGFSACESPLDLTSLSDSFHNFMVRAIDNSGNTDNTPVSFSWTSSPVSEGDILVIDGSAGTSSKGALFSVDPSGNRTIISDFGNAAQGALGSFPSGVVIFPDTNNQQPIADSGPDQTVIEGLLVTLDGTGSSDPDGDSITYSWTQTSGTNVTLSNATIANPTFVAPSTTEEIMLGFSLVVNDGTDPSRPDNVEVTIIPDFSFGPSFLANGTNYLDEPDRLDLRLQEFSLASWFKTSHDFTSNAMIVNKGGLGAGADLNYGMYLDRGERLKGGFESTTGTNKFVTSPNSYNDGNPHYAVATFDLSILKLYVDGSIVATLSTSAIPDAGSSLPVRIAANSAAESMFFIGSIDEVRIWNRTLTGQEVSDQYNSAIFDTAGQVLYLDLFYWKKFGLTVNFGTCS